MSLTNLYEMNSTCRFNLVPDLGFQLFDTQTLRPTSDIKKKSFFLTFEEDTFLYSVICFNPLMHADIYFFK